MRSKAEVLQHFDRMAVGGRWAGLYDQQGDAIENYSFIARRKRVEELIAPLLTPGAKVLDVGCGTGVMGPFVLSCGARYHGIDLSQKMIADAAARFAHSDLNNGQARLEIGDVEDIRHANESFDISMALGVFEYLQDVNRAADELVRVIRPGGSIIVSVPNAWCADAVASAVLSPLVTPAANMAKRLLGRQTPPSGFRHNKFRPGALDAIFARRGCLKTGSAFYNVEIAFYPLRRMAPTWSVHLKRRAEPLADGPASIFSTAYIGRYQKADSRSRTA